MSHCIVPNWNKRHQRQEEIQGEDRNNRQQSQQNLNNVVPMSNYEVRDLTWENGQQLPLHGHGGFLPPQTKHTWSRTGDTLESIVHQATFNNTAKLDRGEVKYLTSMPTSSGGKWVENLNSHNQNKQNRDGNVSSMTASPSGKWRENSSHMQVEQNDGIEIISSIPSSSGVRIISSMAEYCGGNKVENSGSDLVKKRVRSETEVYGGKNSFQVEERASYAGAGAGASASARFCKDNNTDTTMMTWASFESTPSLKAARNTDDDSACQDCSENQDEEFGIKGESFRSQSSATRSRAAVVHNQSERRRRDRINEKMKALQKLVPNASKTDKASMLDEVIEYLKQLQAQVHLLTNARTIPQMVMPLGMQQQLQMSLLGRMGMGMGMGMLDVHNLSRNMPQSFPSLLHGAPPLGTAPSFVSPPFTVPPMVPSLTHLKANIDAANINNSIPNFNDAYGTFLAQQSMNMDFFNKLAALYRQQANQPSKTSNRLSQPNNVQGE